MTVENLTEIDIPLGRIWNDDIVSTEDFGLFENLDVLARWIWDNASEVIGLSNYEPTALFQSDKGHLVLEYRADYCDHEDECEDTKACEDSRKTDEELVYYKYENLTRFVR